MSNTEWYIAELHKKYSESINKIIIDVRNKGGGSDMVWQTLLRNIIDQPMEYHFYVGLNHNKLLEKSLSNFGKIKTEGIFSTVDNYVRLLPVDNTVGFQGNIYLLQNKYTYSVAAALSSIAIQQANMKVIGESNRYIAGYGFSALIFKLPHSGIVYQLPFTADLSGGKENPYLDKVQIQIEEKDPKQFFSFMLAALKSFSSCSSIVCRSAFLQKNKRRYFCSSIYLLYLQCCFKLININLLYQSKYYE